MFSLPWLEQNKETHKHVFVIQLEWSAVKSVTTIFRASAEVLTIVVQFSVMGSHYILALAPARGY